MNANSLPPHTSPSRQGTAAIWALAIMARRCPGGAHGCLWEGLRGEEQEGEEAALLLRALPGLSPLHTNALTLHLWVYELPGPLSIRRMHLLPGKRERGPRGKWANQGWLVAGGRLLSLRWEGGLVGP